MESGKHLFFFPSEQEVASDARHVNFSAVSRVLHFLAAPLFVSNPFFPLSSPLVLCLGDPLFRRKVGEVSGYPVSPPSPFIFFEKMIVVFLL